MIEGNWRGTRMDNVQGLRPRPKKKTIVLGIVIALIVTLSVVAVVMYSQPQGPRTHSGPFGPNKSQIPGGVKITLSPLGKKTSWTDVTILLTDGTNFASWSPLTGDLDNGTAARWNKIALAPNLGALKVNMSITDLAGNGFIDQGDYFNMTVGTGQTFSLASTYTVTMMHDPSAAKIFDISFQG